MADGPVGGTPVVVVVDRRGIVVVVTDFLLAVIVKEDVAGGHAELLVELPGGIKAYAPAVGSLEVVARTEFTFKAEREFLVDFLVDADRCPQSGIRLCHTDYGEHGQEEEKIFFH